MAQVGALADLLVWLSQATLLAAEPTPVITESGAGGWYWVERVSWVAVIVGITVTISGGLYLLLPRIHAGLAKPVPGGVEILSEDQTLDRPNVRLKLGVTCARLLRGVVLIATFQRGISAKNLAEVQEQGNRQVIAPNAAGRMQWEVEIERLYASRRQVVEIDLKDIPNDMKRLNIDLHVAAENRLFGWSRTVTLLLPDESRERLHQPGNVKDLGSAIEAALQSVAAARSTLAKATDDVAAIEAAKQSLVAVNSSLEKAADDVAAIEAAKQSLVAVISSLEKAAGAVTAIRTEAEPVSAVDERQDSTGEPSGNSKKDAC